ncbi:hypothetical protein SS50377_20958 [Spironucleus salmonicida]|uniref:WW domain-containing protein n=1 Tax=Spironucleus salmonicida TaxID=348837 RepID=V6LH43_9EUKA|nr:hypothetical protein SS50377_20958 [Spironucleus salmonicida]|eukprot:EST43628.1 hypothetical protein SS50377_16671 [Spironucleus salmonicida]
MTSLYDVDMSSLSYQLAQFFDIDLEYDKDKDWIIQQSLNAVIPIGFDTQVSTSKQGRTYYVPQSGKSQWIHPVDQFYLDFLDIQQQSLNSYAEVISEIEISFTRRPPRMIRDILALMSFYNIQAQEWQHAWIPLIGLCMDLNFFQYKFNKIEQVYQTDTTEYYWAPHDTFLSQLKVDDLKSQSSWIFPKLTPIESKLLPQNQILAFSLEEMRAYIIDKNNIRNFISLKPPSLQKIDQYLEKYGDCFEYCDIQNFVNDQRIFPVEMYDAHEKASQMLCMGLRPDFKFKK